MSISCRRLRLNIIIRCEGSHAKFRPFSMTSGLTAKNKTETVRLPKKRLDRNRDHLNKTVTGILAKLDCTIHYPFKFFDKK
jgi:hypothetical protein